MKPWDGYEGANSSKFSKFGIMRLKSAIFTFPEKSIYTGYVLQKKLKI